MAAIKIYCPTCGRILGDTERSIDCTINCPKCKAQRVKMKVARLSDYLELIRKEQNTNDKS